MVKFPCNIRLGPPGEAHLGADASAYNWRGTSAQDGFTQDGVTLVEQF